MLLVIQLLFLAITIFLALIQHTAGVIICCTVVLVIQLESLNIANQKRHAQFLKAVQVILKADKKPAK